MRKTNQVTREEKQKIEWRGEGKGEGDVFAETGDGEGGLMGC